MAGRCRERRYADHIFIQIYSRMHHFVVKFSTFSSPQAARGHRPPLTEILQTFLSGGADNVIRCDTEMHCGRHWRGNCGAMCVCVCVAGRISETGGF